ncbi:Protein CBG01180 [Caenorhabditis briggsae]|uniref:Protein CBG01180 n=1 Tax=Caenorhabditis briggsae TaxID=6238 RepID=A8WPS1_CAEBR|nr:Protein CBG01180 [Caenorhabditis briggsae]CAP22478.1 Protein CBG01180 [Caenorhabditis briggsae]
MNPCVVCGKGTTAFNYGANFCNACKIFYQRAMKAENFPTECLNEGNCLKCRFCRYQLCLQAGLHPPTRKSPSPGFSSMLKHLEILDNQRKEKVLSYSQVPNLNFNFWAEATYQTTVEFISGLEVSKLLNDTEQMVLVWQSVRKYNTLCFAMRAYTDQKDMVAFPKGVNPLPPELNLYFQNFPCVLNKIRSNVVAKLREILITNDEFLLISAILICDPVPSMFTESGLSHVYWYQRLYTSTLFQYCQTHYPENGPSRFSDLLSVIGVVIQTIEMYENAMVHAKLGAHLLNPSH